MSEALDINQKTPVLKTKWIVIIAVFLLVFVYIGGYFILPGMIIVSHGTKSCSAVLSIRDIYLGMYPFATLNENNADLVRECGIYVWATTNEEAEVWDISYDAFNVYMERYPQGVFADEAHEQAAVVLMGLVKDDVAQENYFNANNNLDSILKSYSDTSQAAEAEKLKSDLRMQLGMELREMGDFSGAEELFMDINLQAQEDNHEEDVRSSQLELAKTYLAWGSALQSQEKFADARAKFEMVETVAPESSSEAGPAAEAKALEVDLYTQWGDYLITQADFANAMERYKMAASLMEDQSRANEIVANGYIQWAAALNPEDDFFGALVLLDSAEARSDADSIEAAVNDARSDLFLTFSKTDGEKAQKAISDAIQVICNHHVQPRLPIFGLDDENIKIGIGGVDESLPETLTATTPASLHYVVCIEENTEIVDTLSTRVRFTLVGPYGYLKDVTYQNFQYIWNVVLRKVKTGEEVDSLVVTGEEPEVLSLETVDPYTFNYYGSKPAMEDLTDWLLAAME